MQSFTAKAAGSHRPRVAQRSVRKGTNCEQGYTELLELLHKHQEGGGSALHLDIFGSGEDMGDIQVT